jgi:hypothetical protein
MHDGRKCGADTVRHTGKTNQVLAAQPDEIAGQADVHSLTEPIDDAQDACKDKKPRRGDLDTETR